MTVHRYRDVLIEVTILSDAERGGWLVEFWDLSPSGSGELLHIQKLPTGELLLDLLGEKLNVDLVAWAIGIARTELQGY
ncbi:hypothetical protein ACQPZZ_27840 [Microbispora sp. CA-135349]|uniref:hypothetical protein n=1 Tax=Microbispora sp. CA-135349 TaxID=3239953 RepID=UPI003D8B54B6